MNRLERQLQQLNHFPENEQLKAQMKQSLAQQPSKKQFTWKIPTIIMAMCGIFIFLMMTNPERPAQNASTYSAMIYTYFSGEEGSFKARTSTLYTRIQTWESEELIQFFQQINTLPVVNDGKLGSYIVDVIFVENGKQRKFQLSDTDIYDVDEKVYYRENRELYGDVFNQLYSPKRMGALPIFILITVLTNLMSIYYYKKHKIDHKVIYPKSISVHILVTLFASLVLATLFYIIAIGPFYIPIAVIPIVTAAYLQWRYIKYRAPSLNILRFELARILLSFGSMIGILFLF
ncbi:hypothetical protein [Bacillus ndiopicus]|uniref:hypothetical protein n=1 Tax=Bacillus ndiopicus TaxID=1347368 RepID=UPI0005AAB79A|nr:hypothetical protein [Bacillus ndiopicus]